MKKNVLFLMVQQLIRNISLFVLSLFPFANRYEREVGVV